MSKHNLRQIFDHLGVTQLDVAKKVHVKKCSDLPQNKREKALKRLEGPNPSFTSRSYLSSIISRKRVLSLSHAKTIGEALHIDYRFLLPAPDYQVHHSVSIPLIRLLFPGEVIYIEENARKSS